MKGSKNVVERVSSWEAQERHNDEGRPTYEELSISHPRARQLHVCADCRTIIKVGEIYTRRTYLLDGEFKSDAIHDYGAHPDPEDSSLTQADEPRDGLTTAGECEHDWPTLIASGDVCQLGCGAARA